MGNKPAKTVSEKKKKGLLRSTVGGIAKAGGATVKGTAKVAGKSTKLAAKGTYAVGKTTTKATYATGKLATKATYAASKTTTKATYATGKIAAKGGYITMRSGGKTFLFAARKAYPKRPDETKWQYRRRMAKLGFKVSIFTGKIVMAANGSATVEDFAKKVAMDVASDAAQSLTREVVKQSVSKKKKPRRSSPTKAQPTHRPQVAGRSIPPLPPGLNVVGAPPAIPPGLDVPGAPPPVPPGLIIEHLNKS